MNFSQLINHQSRYQGSSGSVADPFFPIFPKVSIKLQPPRPPFRATTLFFPSRRSLCSSPSVYLFPRQVGSIFRARACGMLLLTYAKKRADTRETEREISIREDIATWECNAAPSPAEQMRLTWKKNSAARSDSVEEPRQNRKDGKQG